MEEYNINILQGSDKNIPIKLQDDNGDNLLSTGDTVSFAMQIRPAALADTAYDELTSDNGRIQVDLTESEITLTFPNAITENYSFEEAVYDLEMNKDSEIKRLLQGKIKVDFNVTRV